MQERYNSRRTMEEKMSYDVFINSSVYNFGGRHSDIIETELNKVKNPQWHFSENGDIIIDEDYDMRHCVALQKARDIAWKKNDK